MNSLHSISPADLAQIFNNARTNSSWKNEEAIGPEIFQKIYDLMKYGPTSANCCPIRILFINSEEAKEKLLPCLDPGNVEKTRQAPATAIFAMDMEFYEYLPQLFPHTDAKSWFVGKKEYIEETAFRNSTLQGAYFIIAARALGLDCGPMSGFNKKKVDDTFFAGTSWKANFLCNIGVGDPQKLHPRSPRLSFEQACKIF